MIMIAIFFKKRKSDECGFLERRERGKKKIEITCKSTTGGKAGNKGAEAAIAAIETANLLKALQSEGLAK